MPMHDSPRDQVLDLVVSHGWANMTDGDVESPTGHIALVIIEPAELSAVLDMVAGVDPELRSLISESNSEDDDLVGQFIVRKDSQGFLGVEQFVGRETINARWNALVAEHAAWEGVEPEYHRPALDAVGSWARTPEQQPQHASVEMIEAAMAAGEQHLQVTFTTDPDGVDRAHVSSR